MADVRRKMIDAHVHAWDPARASYPWLEPGPLHRRFDLDEAIPHWDAIGVDGVILVQAADNLDDTRLMIETADRHSRVVGIVAWVPLDEPDAAANLLEELTGDRRIVGIRNLIHDREPGWILRPEVDAGLGVVATNDLVFDYVTADPAALAHLPGIGERHPTLRIVVDHLGKPPVGGGLAERAQWRALLGAVAENPLTAAKISGLSPVNGPWSAAIVRPYIDDALELFGPDRLMYGSDWPVSTLSATPANGWATIERALSSFDEASRTAILGATASTFYRLPERTTS